jgi:hypothetical protein
MRSISLANKNTIWENIYIFHNFTSTVHRVQFWCDSVKRIRDIFPGTADFIPVTETYWRWVYQNLIVIQKDLVCWSWIALRGTQSSGGVATAQETANLLPKQNASFIRSVDSPAATSNTTLHLAQYAVLSASVLAKSNDARRQSTSQQERVYSI